MKNYNKKILESFIIKEQKENEVSLEELLEYRFWQYRNLSEKTNIFKKLLEEEFNKTFNINFQTNISEPRFTIIHKNWSGTGMSDIDIEDTIFRFMWDEKLNKLNELFDVNKELFKELYLASNENNVLGNSNFSTYDTTEQYSLISNSSRVKLAYNYLGFDITEFKISQLIDLSIASPFNFGVDYINNDMNNIKTDEISYYFSRDNIIKRIMLKSMLEKGVYKGQEINPFKSIMIDENNLPNDIVEHVKRKRISR